MTKYIYSIWYKVNILHIMILISTKHISSTYNITHYDINVNNTNIKYLTVLSYH